MNAARELILAKVRAARRWRLPGGGAQDQECVPLGEPGERRDLPAYGADREALVTMLCERLTAYKADVRRIAAADVAATIEKVCRERPARRLVVPPAFPAAWRPAAIECVEDDALDVRDLDALDGAVTACSLAIAETGTLVLTAAPADGRRAITLVPDLHVCVVGEDQVVVDLSAAMPVLAGLVRDERRPLTLISGPSATSDIELQRVEGVHGPRQMVVLVTAAPA